MKTKKPKPRLYSDRKVRMPKPIAKRRDKGFSLRMIDEADSRFRAVKEMRRRLQRLKREAGVDTAAREWLAARAVFLLAYLESQEVASLEGEEINWQRYLMTTRSLTDLLNKLGLDREARSTERLQDIIISERKGQQLLGHHPSH